MGGQCAGELAGGRLLTGALPLSRRGRWSVGPCVCAVFAAFGVLVEVCDVAVASCWLRGGWLASTGDGDGGVLTVCPRDLSPARCFPSQHREVW